MERGIEFCQHKEITGQRCVYAFGHPGNHDVQPRTSASVQAIERQEMVMRRTHDPVPITGDSLIAQIDEAITEDTSKTT